jgi:hypothetical protein
MATLASQKALTCESALDDMVTHLATDLNLEHLNGTECDDEQEEILSSAEKYASEINNQGFECQINFLLLHGASSADINLELGMIQ